MIVIYALAIILTVMVSIYSGLYLSSKIQGSVQRSFFWILYIIVLAGITNIVAIGFFWGVLQHKTGPPGPRGDIGERGDRGQKGICGDICRTKECIQSIRDTIDEELNRLEGNPETPIKNKNKLLLHKINQMCGSKQYELTAPLKGPNNLINYMSSIWKNWTNLIYNSGGSSNGGVNFFNDEYAEDNYGWSGQNPFEEMEKYDVYHFGLTRRFKPPKVEICDSPEETNYLPERGKPPLQIIKTNVYEWMYYNLTTGDHMSFWRPQKGETENGKYYPVGDVLYSTTGITMDWAGYSDTNGNTSRKIGYIYENLVSPPSENDNIPDIKFYSGSNFEGGSINVKPVNGIIVFDSNLKKNWKDGFNWVENKRKEGKLVKNVDFKVNSIKIPKTFKYRTLDGRIIEKDLGITITLHNGKRSGKGFGIKATYANESIISRKTYLPNKGRYHKRKEWYEEAGDFFSGGKGTAFGGPEEASGWKTTTDIKDMENMIYKKYWGTWDAAEKDVGWDGKTQIAIITVRELIRGNDGGPKKDTILVTGDVRGPKSYEEVFKSPSKEHSFSVWKPIPPSGYVALGYVCNKSRTPPPTGPSSPIRCIPARCAIKMDKDPDKRESGFTGYNFGKSGNATADNSYNLFKKNNDQMYYINPQCTSEKDGRSAKTVDKTRNELGIGWHGHPTREPKYSIYSYLGYMPESIITNKLTGRKYYLLHSNIKNLIHNDYDFTKIISINSYILLKYNKKTRTYDRAVGISGDNNIKILPASGADIRQLWEIEFMDNGQFRLKSKETGNYFGHGNYPNLRDLPPYGYCNKDGKPTNDNSKCQTMDSNPIEIQVKPSNKNSEMTIFMNNKSAFGTSMDSMLNTKEHTILQDERKDVHIDVTHKGRLIDGIIDPHINHQLQDKVNKYRAGDDSNFPNL